MDKSRKKSAVLFVCILLVLGMWMMLSVHSQAAETNNDEKQAQTIRVGSFEDTFNYVDKNGVRRGYGYELMQALAGYTEWKFEYVKCDWSDCFDKLENGEIDIMGDISYSDERAQKMLFSDEPMGEEKYILYADLSNMDIGMSDFKFMDGKRVGVLMDTEPEIMLTEWENKNGIHTEHVNVNNDNDVEKKLANHEIDAFVSLNYDNSVQLVVQGATVKPEDGDLFESIIKKYSQYSNIQFIHDSLIGKDWDRALLSVDALLLPYGAERYRYHWAAMLFTAIGFHKPVLISPEINPEVLKQYSIGEFLNLDDVHSIRQGIQTFVENLQHHKEQYNQGLMNANEDYSHRALIQSIIHV